MLNIYLQPQGMRGRGEEKGVDSEAPGAAVLGRLHTSQLHGSSPLKKVGNLGGLVPLRLEFGCLY